MYNKHGQANKEEFVGCTFLLSLNHFCENDARWCALGKKFSARLPRQKMSEISKIQRQAVIICVSTGTIYFLNGGEINII